MATTQGTSAAEDKSFLEHNSVTLSKKPLHDDDWGSKSSRGILPNIHQSSGHEKCQIYFHSKSKLLGEALDSSKKDIISLTVLNKNENDGTNSNNASTTSITKYENKCSGENLESELADRSLAGQRDNEKYNPVETEDTIYPKLTKEVLEQHDQEMERLLRLKYQDKKLRIERYRQVQHNKHEVAEQKIDQGKSSGKTRGRQCPNSDHREHKFSKISKCDDNTKNPEHAGRNPLNIHERDTDRSQPNINMMPQINVRPTLLTNQQYISSCGTSYGNFNSTGYHQSGLTYYKPKLMVGNYAMNMTAGQFNTTSQIQPNPYGLYASPLTGVFYYPDINTPRRAPVINIPQMIPRANSIQPTSLLHPVFRQKPETKEHSASQNTSVEAVLRNTVTLSDSSEKLSSPNRRISSSINVDGIDFSPVGFNSVLKIRQTPQLESCSENSSDSSFYGAFLSNGDTSTSNCHATSSEFLTKKNLEVGESSEKPQTAKRGSFAMVNELKAAYELEKATRRSSSGSLSSCRTRNSPNVA